METKPQRQRRGGAKKRDALNEEYLTRAAAMVRRKHKSFGSRGTIVVVVVANVWRRWETHFSLLFTGSHKITRARLLYVYIIYIYIERERGIPPPPFRERLFSFSFVYVFFRLDSSPPPPVTISYPFFSYIILFINKTSRRKRLLYTGGQEVHTGRAASAGWCLTASDGASDKLCLRIIITRPHSIIIVRGIECEYILCIVYIERSVYIYYNIYVRTIVAVRLARAVVVVVVVVHG